MIIKDKTNNRIVRKNYEDLRSLFRDTARWYNGVNRAWTNKTPDNFPEPGFYGWGGWAISMHSTVGAQYRYTKYKDYESEPDQQQDIPEESVYIHTLGNENYIRDYTKSLNDKVRTRFGNTEYGDSEDYYTLDVNSYKINYIKKDEDGNITSNTTYYAKSYENNNPNAEITLYDNGDLTGSNVKYYVNNFDITVDENGSRVNKTNISPNQLKDYIDNGKNPIINSYNHLEWVGERFIKQNSKGTLANNQPIQKGTASSIPAGVDEPLPYSEENLQNNPSKMSSVEYSTFNDFLGSNQEAVYTKNINTNYKLKNEDLVRQEDVDQIKRLLNKIRNILKKRDGWFDSNGRCNYSCQVTCQKHCQLSCQLCNWSQCHNQHCGSV